MFSGFYKKTCLKEGEVRQNVFLTKLLSHKVCRLLSSPVLLRKFIIIKHATEKY